MNPIEQQQQQQQRRQQLEREEAQREVPCEAVDQEEEEERKRRREEDFKKKVPRMMNMSAFYLKPTSKSCTSAVCLALFLVLFVLINEQVACQEQLLTVENRQLKSNEIDLEALKDLERLEDLDKLWSEKARPR